MSIGRLQTSPSDSRRRFDDECNYFFFSLPLFSLSRPKGKSDTFSLLSIQRERKRGGQKADTRFIVALRLPIVQKFRQSSPICVFFSTKMRWRNATDNISTFYPALPLFFSPFSLLHNIFFALRSFLTFLPLFLSLFFKMTRESRSIFLCEFVVA